MEVDRVQVEKLVREDALVISDGYRAKRAELSDEGLPFARAANIDGGFHFQDAELLSPESVRLADYKVSEPGDVVFTSKGTVGRFALVKEETPKFVYSPQLCFWRTQNTSIIDPRYLFYWMQSPDFLHQLYAVKGQTDMADYVSLRDQRLMEVALPPLPEQRRIAGVLGALDDKIALNRRMNRTLEAMAQALFRHRFVDFAGHDDLVDSGTDLGAIPAGWNAQPLDGVAHFLNGTAWGRYKPETENEKTLPVIKIRELRQGFSEKSDAVSEECLPDKYVIENGDVIFSWSGSLVLKVWTGGRGALNQHLFKVSSEQFPRWFYHAWIKHHIDHFRRIAESKATTMGHIKRHHLTDAKVAVPPPNELTQLGGTFGPLFERHLANKKQSRTLAALRDALLPKLISGAIRVPEAEGLLPDAQ